MRVQILDFRSYVRKWVIMAAIFAVIYGMITLCKTFTFNFHPSYRYEAPRTDAVKTSYAIQVDELSTRERLLYFYWLGE